MKNFKTQIIIFCLSPILAYAAMPLPSSPNTSNFFYKINSSVWIAPSAWKVMRDTELPAAVNSKITLSAARNEFEPIQIIVKPTSTENASVEILGNWNGPAGNVIDAELHEVRYVPITTNYPGDQHGYPGSWPDPLYPISFGQQVIVSAADNQPFWLTVFVPTNATAGTYTNTIRVAVGASTYDIPIELEVFDFELPQLSSFDSYVNASGSSMGMWDDYPNRLNEIAEWWAKHRLNPLGVVNFKWSTVWEHSGKTPPYAPPVDEIDTESNPAYRIREKADKYIMGHGINSPGMSSFEAMRFVNNSTPRPSTFAGVSRGSGHHGTTAYNDKWGEYLFALQNYFDTNVVYNPPTSYGNPYTNDYLSKARYYVMNEPQNSDDYDLAAHLAKISKHYAPKLKIAVSEEPKPQIYDNATYPDARYDVWFANMSHYSSRASNGWVRTKDFDEAIWWYSLGHDAGPFINPVLINRPALEPRLLCWLAWKFRVEGYTYYSWNNWSTTTWTDPDRVETCRNGEGYFLYPEPGTSEARTNFIPSIRLELLRESFEDYEYFILANSGTKPVPFVENNVDIALNTVVPALTGYDLDPAKMLWIRREIGRYISGSRIDLPIMVAENAPHSFGEYHFNFQNPTGKPLDNPLIVNGKTWKKIGWQKYDFTNQIGWVSDDFGFDDRLIENYDQWDDGNELQKSQLYNNWGGRDVFLLGIENGVYMVEVGVGYRAQRDQMVSVNGVPFIGDHNSGTMVKPTGPPNYHMSVSNIVKITGGMLIMEIGRAQSGHNNDGLVNEWTFMNYLSITPAIPE